MAREGKSFLLAVRKGAVKERSYGDVLVVVKVGVIGLAKLSSRAMMWLQQRIEVPG